jgi:hypothetical protein
VITTLVINVKSSRSPGTQAMLSKQMDALATAVMKAVVEHETRPNPQECAITHVVPSNVYADKRLLNHLASAVRSLVHPRKIDIAVIQK